MLEGHLNTDNRKRGRIPFGYEILNGSAVINLDEAGRLKKYFALYLDGMSMAAAAREAGLPFYAKSYPKLFMRREYCGSDYFPAIISKEYQEKLIREWRGRKRETAHREAKPEKMVEIFTEFKLVKGKVPDAPEERPAALYQRIHPLRRCQNERPGNQSKQG